MNYNNQTLKLMINPVSIKKHIPNFLTSLNILCGSMAVMLAFAGEDYLKYSSYCIFIAAVFDFLDGFAARMLKAYSEIGKQLDSLADMISFGLAPSVIMFQFLCEALNVRRFTWDLPIADKLILSSAFLIVIFSGIRLAKFNVDKRQTDSFIGLPTPANALFIAAFPLIANYILLVPELDFKSYLFWISLAFYIATIKYYVLIPIIIILSYLLISELPMFSLKFQNFSYYDNKHRYQFLAISLLLIIIFQTIAIPLIIITYITMSVIHHLHNLRRASKVKKHMDRIFTNENK